MATAEKVESTNPYTECEPERVLQMGFELGAGGPRFDNALDAMVNTAHLETLLDLLDQAPDKEFADAAWAYVDSKDILWTALSEARLDFDVLQRLVQRKRLSAVDPILDVAERADDPRTRERLLDLVLSIGDDVAPYLIRRIDGSRADVRRDLFLAIGKLKTPPRSFNLSPYMTSIDVTLRREAIRLMLKFGETRDEAIFAGVTDNDERALFYVLQAAQEGGCQPRAMAIIRGRIDAGEFDSNLMTLAIRVLAAGDSGAAPRIAGRGRTSQMMRAMHAEQTPAAAAAAGQKTLNWLLARVAEKGFFGRWK